MPFFFKSFWKLPRYYCDGNIGKKEEIEKNPMSGVVTDVFQLMHFIIFSWNPCCNLICLFFWKVSSQYFI